MQPNDAIFSLARILARYLLANPRACDTSDGIARWWIGRQEQADDALLQAALDWLVAQGLMERQVAVDGRVRYRRTTTNPDAQEQLQLLAGATRGQGH